jgi:hypothetical protein
MSGNNAALAQDLIAVVAALIFTRTPVLSAHSAPFVLRFVPVFNLCATPLPESHYPHYVHQGYRLVTLHNLVGSY